MLNTELRYSDYEILLPNICRPGNDFGFSFSTYSNKARSFKCKIGLRYPKGETVVEKLFKLTTGESLSD